LSVPKLRAAAQAGAQGAGFAHLMDLIGLDATRSRARTVAHRPARGRSLFISSAPDLLPDGPLRGHGVKELLLDHLFPVATGTGQNEQ
jgi:hypothetical protein